MDAPKKKNMNSVLAEKYILLANKEKTYTKTENTQIEYAIKVLLSEIEKITLLCIAMAYQNKFLLFILSFSVIFSLKQFLGGTHRKTFWGCFVFSLCFFQVVIELATLITFQYNIILALGYGCLILLKVPLQYNQIKVYSKTEKNKCKIKSILCFSIWYYLTCIIENNSFQQIVLWTLFLQLLEILRVEGVRAICFTKNGYQN